MKLKNLKINFLGDSITEGCGTTNPSYRFSNRLADDFAVISRNYGIGGTRMARNVSRSQVCAYDCDFCMRALYMDKDADVVIVFGGTNDFGHGDAPFGNEGDKLPDTFIGACFFLMNYLTKVYAGKEIIFMTPCKRTDRELGTYSNRPLVDYVNEIKKCAGKFNVKIIDLFDDDNIPALTVDGLHPGDEGHKYIEKIIAEFIENI